MTDHKAHQRQTQMHEHGPHCGHMTVDHGGHEDYLHAGKLEHVHDGKVETHSLEVNAKNPATCTPSHSCGGHTLDHKHSPTCGHEAVPHGDHQDYLVDGHLHHPCDKHCDDHGAIKTSAVTPKTVRPLYDRVLIERVKDADRSKGGIIIPDTAKEKPMEGHVIAVGNGKVADDGSLRTIAVNVGDRVLFEKYGGAEVNLDGADRLIVREDDILAVLER